MTMIAQNVSFMARIRPHSRNSEDDVLAAVERSVNNLISKVRDEHGIDAIVLNGEADSKVFEDDTGRYAYCAQPVLVDDERVKVEAYG